MDAQNYNDVVALTKKRKPKSKSENDHELFGARQKHPVPDPYYDGRFALVYEMLKNSRSDGFTQLAGTEV